MMENFTDFILERVDALGGGNAPVIFLVLVMILLGYEFFIPWSDGRKKYIHALATSFMSAMLISLYCKAYVYELIGIKILAALFVLDLIDLGGSLRNTCIRAELLKNDDECLTLEDLTDPFD